MSTDSDGQMATSVKADSLFSQHIRKNSLKKIHEQMEKKEQKKSNSSALS